jgi:hypothetical protein
MACFSNFYIIGVGTALASSFPFFILFELGFSDTAVQKTLLYSWEWECKKIVLSVEIHCKRQLNGLSDDFFFVNGP